MSIQLQTQRIPNTDQAFTPALSGFLQRKCACGSHAMAGGGCAECRNNQLGLQRKAINQSEGSDVPPIVHDVLHSSGQPLDSNTRAFMESRFGHDFSQVRVHTDAQAAESARAVNALAYTVGRDICFGDAQYAPGTNEGHKLIAHELTHVAQQGNSPANHLTSLRIGPISSLFEREAEAFSQDDSMLRTGSRLSLVESVPQLQRQLRNNHGEAKLKPPKLNYRIAEKGNKSFSRPDSLGWEGKLETISKGAYKAWGELWKEGQYEEFADAVAEFQSERGFAKKDVDGILGLGTWAKVAGLGEAMAGIRAVNDAASQEYCIKATMERIRRGYKLARGDQFKVPDEKQSKTFEIIFYSTLGLMSEVDKEYRGTGAAGALVYAGLAKFVEQSDIWGGKLHAGAALQVWGHREAYDLMQAGKIEDSKTGELRKLTISDADFYGTSFVFVRYDPENPTRMLVRHFGSDEWKDSSDYEVWIAANIS